MSIHSITTATATLDELRQQRARVVGEWHAVNAETDPWVCQGWRFCNKEKCSDAREKILASLESRIALMDTAIQHAEARITAAPDERLPAGIQAIVDRKRAVVTPADFRRAVMAEVARWSA